MTARLPRAHLSDHPAAAEKLAEQLRPGTELGPLLVLQPAAGEDRWKEGGGKKARRKKAGAAGVLVRVRPPGGAPACLIVTLRAALVVARLPPFRALLNTAHRTALGSLGNPTPTTRRPRQVTRKSSLLAAAAALPAALDAVAPGARLPGYVAHVTGDAVFVRFLNGVTGRCGD